MSETIRSLLTSAKAMLLDCVEQPEFEAQLLLAFVLSESREHLLAWPEKSCDEKVRLSFFELLDARVQGKPIAYILGEKSFWDITLTVNSDVLIPRPETEMLVELVLECVSQNSKSEIAELGTGSGAIVCALAHHLPKASFVARLTPPSPGYIIAKRPKTSAKINPKLKIIPQTTNEKFPTILYKSGGSKISPEPKIGPIISPDRVNVFNFLVSLFTYFIITFFFLNIIILFSILTAKRVSTTPIIVVI